MNDQAFLPLYKRLFSFYRDKIIKQDYRAGERIDSIRRIMERHRVSRETAKLVLSMLSDQGLIVKKAGKGSFVTFTSETKKIWGIVIPFYSTNIEDLIVCLNNEAVIKEREIRYFLHYNEPEEEMRITGRMIRDGYEAVLVVPNYDESMTADFYRNLNSGNSRLILVDNTMVGSFFNYVIQSYDLGVKRAFNYLISNNKKNLLFVKNDIWQGKNMVYELMEDTLRLLISSQTPDRELLVLSGITGINRTFIAENEIGGILCSSDIDSLRLTGRLSRWGVSMPEEVSVVSYGNTELTQLISPAITAVDCNYPEMARLTASLIFKGKKPADTAQHVIQPELIVRQT